MEDSMIKKVFTEEEVKESVEKFMADSFGKIFNDELSVYRITPATMFSQYDYIFLKSKNMPKSTITVRRSNDSDDISCDYMHVYYREKHIKPLLDNACNELFKKYCLLINNKDYAYGPIDYEMTLDKFMIQYGVSFDVLVCVDDFEKNGKEYYEDAIKMLVNDAAEKDWKYRVVTLWVCDNLPNEKVSNMQIFDSKWSDTCKKLKHLNVFMEDNKKISVSDWIES